jgi:hypothetical protein
LLRQQALLFTFKESKINDLTKLSANAFLPQKWLQKSAEANDLFIGPVRLGLKGGGSKLQHHVCEQCWRLICMNYQSSSSGRIKLTGDIINPSTFLASGM